MCVKEEMKIRIVVHLILKSVPKMVLKITLADKVITFPTHIL